MEGGRREAGEGMGAGVGRVVGGGLAKHTLWRLWLMWSLMVSSPGGKYLEVLELVRPGQE